MEQLCKYYKNNPTDIIWWVDSREKIGEWIFTFDKKIFFSMFRDYPYKLTAEQKKIFDSENPFWAKFFSDRM